MILKHLKDPDIQGLAIVAVLVFIIIFGAWFAPTPEMDWVSR